MPDSLFEDDPALEPAVNQNARYQALRNLRRDSYSSRLMENPPADSTDPQKVGPVTALATAKTLGRYDEHRMNEAEHRVGLALISIERLGALESALREWVKAFDEDCASGGNGSESVDVEALVSRTLLLLEQSYVGYLIGETQ